LICCCISDLLINGLTTSTDGLLISSSLIIKMLELSYRNPTLNVFLMHFINCICTLLIVFVLDLICIITYFTFLAQDMTYLDLISQGQRLCQLNKFEDALPVLEKALYKVSFIFTHYMSMKVIIIMSVTNMSVMNRHFYSIF
jgi:hypothetical protein